MTVVKSSNLKFPALFDDFFNRDFFNWRMSNLTNGNSSIPAVNIKETPQGFLVDVAAPGMKKTDFKVTLEDNLLNISSEKSMENEEQSDDESYRSREFSYQSFSRSFTLPQDMVDAEKIEAKYEDGVLKLTIPKTEKAKQHQPKMINIS